MGTSVALELVRRGHSVSVFERFAQGHTRGSSHGPNRIFRLSYEDPAYVDLAVQALEDWKRLERDSRLSEDLITFVGGIDLGLGARLCAEAMATSSVDFEELSPGVIKQRWDLVAPDGPVIYQEAAGIIAAEKTVAAQAALASHAGATFTENTVIDSIDQDGQDVLLRSGTAEIAADIVVVCAGPWASGLLATAGIPLPVFVSLEQVTYLDEPAGTAAGLPVVIDWSLPPRYLVPAAGGKMKIGSHVGSRAGTNEVDPEDGPFTVSAERAEGDLDWARRLTGRSLTEGHSETCLYTNAPNDDFIFERHDRVVVVSACSGHGFKFAPRIGRVAADIVEGKDPGLPGRLGHWWKPPSVIQHPVDL